MRRTSWLFAIAALVSACKGNDPRFTDAAVPTDADEIDAPVDAGIDAPVGHPGTGIVTGAVKATSPGYKLYGTLRSGDGSSTSPEYGRRGGITGATQP
ncbi:MAG TPA: hypothetical protein VM261_21365 [Kofleriaceae bacterium]|nr:hypothetical protein [Kofleriaceae bacterium]